MTKTETKTQTSAPLWHTLPLETVLQNLKVKPELGLSAEEVTLRRETYGRDNLPKGKKTPAIAIFLRQFKSPLVYILLVAAALTWWLKEFVDLFVIALVVLINAAIGYYQEYRASQIFEKLKAIVKVTALVIREGKLTSMDAGELVPGDIIVIKGGDKIPGDARLLSASDLDVNEALLTGESKPVRKDLKEIPAHAIVSDQKNMVFMGTVCEVGEGKAVVVATGAATQIGQISLLTQKTEDELSPLQLRMKKLGNFLSEIFVAIAVAIFLVGMFRGHELSEMFKTTIAVAVAAIPEGLPAAISVILAVASQKILNRKGLVRKLVAAETLGSTSVICADKTGTLTLGQMQVEEILTPKSEDALLVLALANEAIIQYQSGKPEVRGEATDKAKLEYFPAHGGNLEDTLRKFPREHLYPFDPVKKYLASFHKDKKNMVAFVSGAPEIVFALSTLSKTEAKSQRNLSENLARRGFRVIALARKYVKFSEEKEIRDLEYLGLASIRDPIRDDVKGTLKITREAGIKIIMITGDHISTAKAIGLELGFHTQDEAVITGEAMDALSDNELSRQLPKLEIIARATPVHKMRIIEIYQSQKAVVAMTGDGVNDAPALKAADIGLALGSGTDVAKEASDLVLLDDSFSTIAAAVEEGRAGFANIKKATLIVLSNAFTEVLLITSSLALGTPFPITAVQILWVNLVTDSLPVLSLAFEPAETATMRQKPNSPTAPILDKEIKSIILTVGVMVDLLLVGLFFWLFKYSGWEFRQIQTLVFAATATPTLVNIFAFKSLKTPLTKINLTNNKLLIYSVILGLFLMGTAIYLPILQKFLGTAALPAAGITIVILFTATKLLVAELVKWWYNRDNLILKI